jgi:hypothetical protein
MYDLVGRGVVGAAEGLTFVHETVMKRERLTSPPVHQALAMR